MIASHRPVYPDRSPVKREGGGSTACRGEGERSVVAVPKLPCEANVRKRKGSAGFQVTHDW